MQSFIIPIVALSVPALCLSLFRKTWWWPLLCWLVGTVAGVVMGWLSVEDTWVLPLETHLLTDGGSIVVFLIWSALVGEGLRWTPKSNRDALLLGASVGAFAATWSLQREEETVDKHTLWLAFAGSLIHPGTLLGGVYFLLSSVIWVVLPLCAVVMVLLSERKTDNQEREVPKRLPFAGVILLVSAVVPQWAVPLLVGTSLVWCGLCARNFPWKRILWIVGVLLSVNLAVAGGLAEAAAWGLEELPMEFHRLLPVGILISTTLLSMVIGVVPMAMFGVALFERTMDLPAIGLSKDPLLVAYGLGLVLGNVYPWVFNGVWIEHCRGKWGSWMAITALTGLVVAIVL